MEEEWRDIIEHPVYQVSNLGRVRRLPCKYRRQIQIRKTFLSKAGYVMVALWEGRRIVRSVHQLVTNAFCGIRPDPSYQVRHLDGNPQNNQPANLVWGTPLENSSDTRRLGRLACRERHGMAKLTNKDVKQIKAIQGVPQWVIARQFNIDRTRICRIRNGRAWL